MRNETLERDASTRYQNSTFMCKKYVFLKEHTSQTLTEHRDFNLVADRDCLEFLNIPTIYKKVRWSKE